MTASHDTTVLVATSRACFDELENFKSTADQAGGVLKLRMVLIFCSKLSCGKGNFVIGFCCIKLMAASLNFTKSKFLP